MNAEMLLTLARAYSQALGIALSTVGDRACGNVRVFTRLSEGKGCNSRTIERAGAWFARNWPDDVQWPDSVPRPKAEQDQAA